MARTFLLNPLFDTFGNLPLHPLAVHGAAVLIPLSALALILLVFVPKWRATYLPLTVLGLLASMGIAFVAKESGEALAERVGNPATHAEFGDILFPASVGLFLIGLAFYVLQKQNRAKWQQQLTAGVAVLAALSVGILTYFVGHSGAEATWANRLEQTQAQEIAAPSGSTEAVGGLSAEQVASHNTKSDCWTVIDGTVYDLTSYIPVHKGGPLPLESICGKDGTNAFSGQHSGEQRPAMDLSALAVGPLAGVTATSEPSASATEESSAAPTQTSTAGLTAAEVAKHTTANDCWSVVGSNVYDLTPYVSSHPGGQSVIKAICGKDGTAAFTAQHGTVGKAANVLAGFKLGALVGAAASTSLPQATVIPGEGYEEDEDEDEEHERDDD
jgi:cytochrome b involved in lipid metabolism